MIKDICVASLGAPSHVIAIPEAENWQKEHNFEPVYLDVDKKRLWFLNTLLNIFLMIMFIYSALNKIFPYFFLFSSIAIYF